MATKVVQKSDSTRRTGSKYFYIQPIWKIQGLCNAGTCDSDDGPGRFPAYVRVHYSTLKDVLEHKVLSPEALAYYTYWIASNERMVQWSTVQEKELQLSSKQVLRLRQELRAAGLLTMTRAGKQTYSCIHRAPIHPDERTRVAQLYAENIKRQWGLQQRYRCQNPYIDSVTPFFSKHYGVASGKVMVVFKDSIHKGASDILLSSRGMDRLKALGLWMLLCSRQAWYNWSTPANIAKELGFSRPYVLKHFKHLMDLKLVYYAEKEKIIGVSRFPEGVHEQLHPMSCEHSSIPWKYFQRGGL
jgi:hypothetical protein